MIGKLRLSLLFSFFCVFALFSVYIYRHYIVNQSSYNKVTSKYTLVYIQKDFPLYDKFSKYFSGLKGYQLTIDSKKANIVISSSNSSENSLKVYDNIMVLVEDFKSVNSNLSLSDYKSLLNTSNIEIDPSLKGFYPKLSVNNTSIISYISSGKYEIIPFDTLNNTYKTVSIDDNSPLQKKFNEANYPLKAEYFLSSKSSLPESIRSWVNANTFTNYDKNAIHTVIITGTTALGRGEYFRILSHDYTYPALYVASIMRNADITEVSDEVSYVPNCTQQVGTLQFCALPYFINTLKYAGVNLVELTGNHNNDWGSQFSLSSLSLYDQNNIKHFGGGANDTDARKPAIFKLNGTTFAFLGYNQPGPSYAFATSTTSGAAKLDINNMIEDIQNAKNEADVVFVDVQWENENNQYPTQSQIDISRIAIDSGADVVTGSQAHRPEGMEFYKGKTIMYGLGNLFFDQMENLDTRQNVIVRHTFYNSKLISTELIPTLLYDYSQPRPVTGDDAKAILDEIWQASTNVL